jgi:hypothetical protein
MANLHNSCEEQWKTITGYEGQYEVSTHGRVKSLYRTYQLRWVTIEVLEKFLKPELSNTGYNRVTLTKNGKKSKVSIHRIVALAFLGNTPHLHVNHKDGDKLNNHADNLEWVTASDNQKHAFANGLQGRQIGIKSSSAKLNEDDIREIRSLYATGNIYQQQIADKFKISLSQVSDIINKKRAGWSHVA